ncbi:hypothetical protein M2451_003248 [Dysgonomonas sp. PFB1-18]|uniref:hypothetical protein n=1 Tax=unclassified Dysgonomonas TaxID=2630389 RepID=UPI0024733EE6|nr:MULTISPECIES: hypothetical protein [unclassified Dysgonomonas]MDH6310361.1 hypothetical protein [Dysgonomonas sp. PF1-14]MDH6340309.1 hypothetical protein [Dysgonomonas sp. PF1-16]MDH6381911.1 hypothetical protein [Dysgonomonas sp. PFB1-18]MDH6399280.1 hypothetical protein [Dysgonomonas sp. PF1-23]
MARADARLSDDYSALSARATLCISSASGHLSGAGGVERDGAIARLSLSAAKPLTGRRGAKH